MAENTKEQKRRIVNVDDSIPTPALTKSKCHIQMKDKAIKSYFPLHIDVMSICTANHFWWLKKYE